MSFLRHREIYRSDGLGFCKSGAQSGRLHAPTHRFDEYPAGYSLAGCAPAEPASASPAGRQSTMMGALQPSFFQRMGKPCLAGCLTSGVHLERHPVRPVRACMLYFSSKLVTTLIRTGSRCFGGI